MSLTAETNRKRQLGFLLLMGIALLGMVVILVQRLAVMPLGLTTFLTFQQLVLSAVLTGLWCGVVGAVLAFDLGKHWRAYRLRKLR